LSVIRIKKGSDPNYFVAGVGAQAKTYSFHENEDPAWVDIPEGVGLLSLAITPDLPDVAIGSKIQMTAMGTFSDGSVLNLTSGVAWSTDNGAVASITSGSGGGVFTAIGQGSCNVTASLNGVSASIPATVPVASAFNTGWAVPSNLGATPEAGGRVYSLPLFVPPDVTSVSVRLANRISDQTVQPSITLNIAVYQSDGTGKPTGSAFAVFNGNVVPGDNTSVLVGPFNGVVRGTDGKIVLLIGMAQGQQPVFPPNVTLGNYVSGTAAVNVAPGAFTGPGLSVIDARFVYNTGARHVIVIGDAIESGYDPSATLNFSQTFPQLIAVDRLYAVEPVGIVGNATIGSLQHWAAFATQTNWWDLPAWASADVLICAGLQDLSYANLATMKTSLSTLITHLQTLGVNKIYAATVAPQAAYPGTDAIRIAYNSYLLANFGVLGLTAVRDRAAAQNVGGMADNVNPNIMFAAYAQVDGTNWTAAGHAQERAGWEAIL
jgi:hypothetical protein